MLLAVSVLCFAVGRIELGEESGSGRKIGSLIVVCFDTRLGRNSELGDWRSTVYTVSSESAYALVVHWRFHTLDPGVSLEAHYPYRLLPKARARWFFLTLIMTLSLRCRYR